NRGVNQLELRFVGRDVLNARGQSPFAGLIFVHEQTPDAGEKTRKAFHAFHAPRLHLLERAHEHFVAAKGVRAVLGDDIEWIDDIAPALRHFAVVFAQDYSLVHQTLERLRFRNVAEIKKHLVPKARIYKVQDGVLRPANVKIDPARLFSAHPVAFGLFSDEPRLVSRIAEP